jgi:hypothetical protein
VAGDGRIHVSITTHFLPRVLILSFMLTIIASSHSGAEPMVIAWVGPRVDVTKESPFREEQARPFTVIRVGPRVGVSGRSPFGRDQKENFQQYDVAALFGLPWGWQERASGMKLDMRLLASAGELAAAGDTGLMVTLVPCLAVSSANEAVSIDVGGGAGFFSRYNFGVQNFGGPAQFVGTAGLGLNLIPGFYTGYRFQHFSDAATYGPSSLGVDMHILEINYQF